MNFDSALYEKINEKINTAIDDHLDFVLWFVLLTKNLSKSPFFRCYILHDQKVGLDTVEYVIYIGVWFVLLKDIVPDPGKPEPENRNIDKLEDIKGQQRVYEDQECQSNADDMEPLIGLAFVLLEILYQERVLLMLLLNQVVVHFFVIIGWFFLYKL